MSKRRPDQPQAHWDFFSFPVYFAFALGAFVATLLYPLGFYVFILSLFATSFGVAHIVGQWLRRRTSERRRRQVEEDERERRALAARQAALATGEDAPARRRRRRARRSGA